MLLCDLLIVRKLSCNCGSLKIYLFENIHVYMIL